MRPDGVCVGMNTSLLRSSLNYGVVFSFFLDFFERIMVECFWFMRDVHWTQRGFCVARKIFVSAFWQMATEALKHDPYKVLFPLNKMFFQIIDFYVFVFTVLIIKLSLFQI